PSLMTDGILRINASRIVPPPTAVMVPKIIACAGPNPNSMALLAPVTANTLSPTASRISMGMVNRLRSQEKANAIRAPAAATAMNRQSRNVAGGTSPNTMSRIIPPPMAVIMPSVRTPTMSTRATRTAVSPPLSAKANVPSKSRTSNGVGDPFILHLRSENRRAFWRSLHADATRSSACRDLQKARLFSDRRCKMNGSPTPLLVLDLLGTFAFALNGGLTAVRVARVDIVGVLTLGMITAMGGGIIRDILLGDVPPATFRDWRYLAVAAAGALIAFAFSWLLNRLAM